MGFSKSLEGHILKDHSGEKRYQLGRLIGEGGFGHVYEARDLKFDSHRRVAVKVVKPGFAKQIRREAILGQVEHPNVVRYLDFGVDGDLPYIVMEYLSGRSLDKLGRLSEKRFHKFVQHVFSALQRAHEENLIHRDLKPQNIMLVDEGRPEERFVILDFGIASQLDASQSLRGATMDGAGTPEYMPPEQLRGNEPTRQSDIYSLAVILYQQLTGRVPFPMETPSLPAFFELVINNDPPRFRDAVGNGHLSSLAEDLEDVILRCLAKDPHARVASMEEFLGIIEEISGQSGEAHQNVVQDSEKAEKLAPEKIKHNRPKTGVADQLDSEKAEKFAPEKIKHNGPKTGVADQQNSFDQYADTEIDSNKISPVDQQALKPETPKQHISHDHSDRLDSREPVNGTLTPDSAGHMPVQSEPRIMSGLSNEAAQSIPQKRDSLEHEIPSAYPQRPAGRERSEFPIGKICTALVVSAVILFAGVLYPLIRRNRLENQLERSLENSGYAEAAQTVKDIDFLTQLWVDQDKMLQKIRKDGNQKARDFADDRNWNDAITECVSLHEAFPDDPESRRILKEIVGTIEHQVEIDSNANRYRDAVESLNPNNNEVVEKLVEFDANLISPELLTEKIRSKGLEKINSYLDREQPQEAVRTGMDLQRAFRQDLEVKRAVIRARIAMHAADGSQFSKENLFSKAVGEYTQALELASEPSQKSSLTLERAKIYKHWAEDDESPNAKPDDILSRFETVFEELKSLLDQMTPISGAHELQAETFLSRAEFYLKQAESLDGEQQRLQKNDTVRSAIGDLHLASDGPLDEEHRNNPEELLQNIATIYLTDGLACFNQALDLSENEQQDLNSSSEQKFQASIEALSIAILAQENQAEGYFIRAGARTHLRKPDCDGSLKDFQKFEQLAQEQLNSSDNSSDEHLKFTNFLAKSYSLHAWVLATCSRKDLQDGMKALELAKRAEKLFDSLEGKLPDDDWLMARSDVFKSKAAAYAQMGNFEKAITTTKRILADLISPPTDKLKANYTSEQIEWTIHKMLLEQFYKKNILPPFRFQ